MTIVIPGAAVKAAVPPQDSFVLNVADGYRDDGEAGGINVSKISKAFYATHPDTYDFLLIYTNAPQRGQMASHYYTQVKGNTSGYSVFPQTFDISTTFGSAGTLKGIALAGEMTTEPTTGGALQLQSSIHEISHHWLAYVQSIASDAAITPALPHGHWSPSFFVGEVEKGKRYCSPNTCGEIWKPIGDGVFEQVILSADDSTNYWQRFSWFELYLMGLAAKNEIQPITYTKYNGEPFDAGEGRGILRVKGTQSMLSADQLLSNLGNLPVAYPNAQKDFRVAFVFAIDPSMPTTNQQKEKLAQLAEEVPQVWYAATRHRSTMNGVAYSAESSNPPTEEKATDGVVDRELSRFVSTDASLVARLRGKILLQVEDHGEAWWLDPAAGKRRYMGRSTDALALMRQHGLGVSNADLLKIPISKNFSFGMDADADSLSDAIETAIGSDPQSSDTDRDGYADGTEIANGHNPLGPGKQPVSTELARRLAGKILLQVEGRGEAWYVNPVDGKRYFLGRPSDALQLMRSLGLGISNSDLNHIPPTL